MLVFILNRILIVSHTSGEVHLIKSRVSNRNSCHIYRATFHYYYSTIIFVGCDSSSQRRRGRRHYQEGGSRFQDGGNCIGLPSTSSAESLPSGSGSSTQVLLFFQYQSSQPMDSSTGMGYLHNRIKHKN